MKSFENLYDLIIREQVISMGCPDLALFIKEHVPKDLEALTAIADQYREARGVDITSLSAPRSSLRSGAVVRANTGPVKAGDGGHNRGYNTEDKSFHKGRNRAQDIGRYEMRCYRCVCLGHITSGNKCQTKLIHNTGANVQNFRGRSLSNVRFHDQSNR